MHSSIVQCAYVCIILRLICTHTHTLSLSNSLTFTYCRTLVIYVHTHPPTHTHRHTHTHMNASTPMSFLSGWVGRCIRLRSMCQKRPGMCQKRPSMCTDVAAAERWRLSLWQKFLKVSALVSLLCKVTVWSTFEIFFWPPPTLLPRSADASLSQGTSLRDSQHNMWSLWAHVSMQVCTCACISYVCVCTHVYYVWRLTFPRDVTARDRIYWPRKRPTKCQKRPRKRPTKCQKRPRKRPTRDRIYWLSGMAACQHAACDTRVRL